MNIFQGKKWKTALDKAMATIKKAFSLWPVKIALMALVVIFPFIVTNTYLVFIAVTIIITSISLLGYNFITGYAGTFILSQAAFYGVGAYVSIFLSKSMGVPVILSTIAGGILACGIGFLLSLPTQKLNAVFLTLATLAFNQIMFIVFQNVDVVTGGVYGIKDIPRPNFFGTPMNDKIYYLYVLLWLVVTWIVIKRLLLSKTGRVMFSIAVDPMVAASVGADTAKYRTLAFCVAAFFGGVAGALSAHFIKYVYPNNFNIDVTITQLAMLALGGLASMSGSIIGPAIYTFISLYFAELYDYRLLICGALLIVCMLFKPQGLAGGKPAGIRKKSERYIQELKL